MTLLVTGGAGFIGGNFVHHHCGLSDEPLVVLDKLTYAGNPLTIEPLIATGQATLVQGDICDRALVQQLLTTHRPRAVLHFAAESHVDRSIHGPGEFVQSNVVGTYCLLEEVRAHWCALTLVEREDFRFLHVSTDEVYGALGEGDPPFDELTPYAPNNPYAASKAGADHLVRSYFRTYGLPTLTSNCSDNFGPYQFPEKLIPLMILNAVEGKSLPLYGDGLHVRDWLYVRDHCEALRLVLNRGRVGETYCIGGQHETRNIDIVTEICRRLDVLRPRSDGVRYESQIIFMADRPGHDRRYAINPSKIQREIGWFPVETFDSGLDKTVAWFLEQSVWVDSVRSGAYRRWIDRHYGQH